jgi:UDP-3-O-[3-hydroxymyristoyl] glucosamine N-acyltransferase
MENDTAPLTSVALGDLAGMLEADAPEVDLEITGVATIEDAGPHDLTFLSNERYVVALQSSRAGAVLVAADYDGDAPMPMLRSGSPRLAFARAVALFHPPRPRAPGIHPTAVVPESCSLGAGVAIGPYVVLGERVTVGDDCTLHAHAVVYDDVVMGRACEIHSHACVREGVKLGDRVVLQNGAMIGADGFGFEPEADGALRKVPQVGTVQLGDDVEVQANACIDRPVLGATSVGRGTKIDNLAQIGHGCTVGEHSILCGQVGLAGSTRVGNHVMLGGQVGSGGHIVIGDGAKVGAQSGLAQDLEGGKEYLGSPAFPKGDALRSMMYLGRLHELARRIKKLEKAVVKLSAPAD